MDARMQMSRRTVLRFGALAAGLGWLAACAPAAAPAPTPTPAPAKPAEAPKPEAQPTPTPKPATAPAPATKQVRLELWTFVNTHGRWFRAMAEDFKKVRPVEWNVVDTVTGTQYFDKLQVALQTKSGVPDLVDIEQGPFGRFLKGEVQLRDLRPRLTQEGFWDKLVQTRQALYTWQGKTYGIEHALTPVVLYYRRDFFQEAGIKAEDLKTWDDYIEAGKKLTKGDRFMLPLPPVEPLIRQRGVDFFNTKGEVTIDDPKVIETVQWILDLVYVHKIAEIPPTGPAFWGAVKAGRYATLIGADWYAGFIKDNAPETKGKWGAVPLPIWKDDPEKRNTSCFGGTGNCITLATQYDDLCWEFQKFTMLSVEGNVRRFELTNLFPPLIPAMSDPRLHIKDPFFDGQDLGQLFQEVAPNVPPQYQHPYRAELVNLWGQKVFPDVRDRKITVAEGCKRVAEEVRALIAKGA